MSQFIRALAGAEGDVVVVISNSTEVVKEAQRIHQTSAVVTAALGRVLTATQLMVTFLKNDKASVSLQIHGSGPLKKIYAYADLKGHLKGYVSDTTIENRVKPNGKLDVSGVVGKHGQIMVSRDSGFGIPFLGQADLISGEIAEDLAHYYAYSEQQPSVISLGVLVGPDDVPMASGGLMIQTLPDCSEASIVALEGRLEFLRPMSDMIHQGLSLEEILAEVLGDMPYHIIAEGSFNYQCDCNRDKIEGAMITLGADELTKILHEDGKMELSCHFCGRQFHYHAKDIKHLIKHMKTVQTRQGLEDEEQGGEGQET